MILQDADIYRVFIGRFTTLNNVIIKKKENRPTLLTRKGTETTQRKIVRIIE